MEFPVKNGTFFSFCCQLNTHTSHIIAHKQCARVSVIVFELKGRGEEAKGEIGRS